MIFASPQNHVLLILNASHQTACGMIGLLGQDVTKIIKSDRDPRSMRPSVEENLALAVLWKWAVVLHETAY